MANNRPVGEPFEGSDTRAVPVIPVDKLGNVISGGSGSGDMGAGATSYQSPGDFGVAWASATTLNLSGLPFPPLFEQFAQVAEFDGDTLVARYSIDDPAFDWTWTPGADASTGVLEVDTATFTTGNTFVVQIKGPERDTLDVLTDFGGPYIHQSPRDFDVVFASATTLTVGGVTPMEMSPDADSIRAVVEIAAGGQVRMTYTRKEWAFTWAAGAAGEGVLTIAGATMQNGSSFIMFVEGPEHLTSIADTVRNTDTWVKHTQMIDAAGTVLMSLSTMARAGFVRLTNGAIEALLSVADAARSTADVVLSTQNLGADGNPTPSGFNAAAAIHTRSADGGTIPAGGRGQWSKGQGDFTAVFASSTTLTLGAFPSALGTPDDGDFFVVIATTAAGLQVAYSPAYHAMTLAGQVLTVTGASFLNTDLDYDVFVWGPPRGYSAGVNGDQVQVLNPDRFYQDSPQESASGLGDGTTHKYFDVEFGHIGTFRILDTPGVAGDNTYTLHESVLNDGTAEGSADYQDVTMDEVGQAQVTSAEIAATPSIGRWKIVAFQAKRYCITCVRANDGANTDGAYQYDLMET